MKNIFKISEPVLKTYDDLTKELLSKMVVGTKFKHDGYLKHVLAIVDGNQLVVKYYGKHKQWWHYEVLSIYSLAVSYQTGGLIIK